MVFFFICTCLNSHILVISFLSSRNGTFAGMKLGKLLSLFPVMYLSGGTCVLLIMNGGSCLRSVYTEMWGYDNTKPASSDAGWCLLFIIIAVIVSQFSPNLDSAAKIAAIGTLAAVMYSTLLVVLSLVHNQANGISYSVKQAPKEQKEIYGAMNAFGLIAFAFRGHNVILDIQVSKGIYKFLFAGMFLQST